MEIKPEKLQDLDVLSIHRSDDAPLVMLLHGYGANFKDLLPLHQFLDPLRRFNWTFVNGPVKIDTGMPFDSRGWFPLDVELLAQRASSASYQAMAEMTYPGMEDISQKLSSGLQSLSKKFEKIMLGGFSQGSILSLNLFLNHQVDIDGLCLFSPAIADEKKWLPNFATSKKIPVFISHGRQDPVLPFGLAERLSKHFIQHQFPTIFHPFNGGHEIPMDALQAATDFLNDLFPREKL